MGVLQSKMGKVSTSTGAVTITLDSATGGPGAVGGTGLLVFFVSAALSSNPHISTITLGGSSDHWTSQLSAGGSGNHSFVNFWSDLNCAAGQTSVVITPTGGSGAGSILCWVFECDDLPLTGTLIDKSTTFDSSGFVSAWTIGATAATTQASERVFAVGGGNSNTTTVCTFTGPSSPWNNFQQGQFPGSGSNAPSGMAGYKDVSSTGTQSYVVTASSPTCTVDGLIVTIPLVSTSDSGTVAVTTKKSTVTISGNVITSGTAVVTAKKQTVSVSGNVITSGTVSAIAKKPTIAVSGNVIDSGATAVTLKKLTVTGTATAPIAGTASVTLNKMTAAVSGNITDSGTSGITLKKLTVSGTATAPLVGTANITLKKTVTAVSVNVIDSGTSGITLKKLIVAGTATAPLVGTADVTLKKLTVTGSVFVIATASITLKKTTVSVAGKTIDSATVSVTLRKMTTAGTGRALVSGVIAVGLRKIDVSGTGFAPVFGTAVIVLPKTEAIASDGHSSGASSLFIFSQL